MKKYLLIVLIAGLMPFSALAFSIIPNPPINDTPIFITTATAGHSYQILGCTLEYTDLGTSIQDNCGTSYTAGDVIHVDEYDDILGSGGTGSIVSSNDFTVLATGAMTTDCGGHFIDSNTTDCASASLLTKLEGMIGVLISKYWGAMLAVIVILLVWAFGRRILNYFSF